jgi:hypothetical protein
LDPYPLPADSIHVEISEIHRENVGKFGKVNLELLIEGK